MKRPFCLIAIIVLLASLLQPALSFAENSQDADISILWESAMGQQPMPKGDDALRLALEELSRIKTNSQAALLAAAEELATVKSQAEEAAAKAAQELENIKQQAEEAAKAAADELATLKAQAEKTANELAILKAQAEEATKAGTNEPANANSHVKELTTNNRAPVAYIMYADASWANQYWYDGNEYPITAKNAVIDGFGDYTVSLEFNEEAQGLAFAAIGIVNGEKTYPGAYLQIKEIRVNGEAIPFEKGYTSSDDGIDTRMNVYNEWVSELPADARSFDGSLDGASPIIVDKELFGAVKTLEIDFILHQFPVDTTNMNTNRTDAHKPTQAATAQDISISVQWTDALGNAQFSAPAIPVTSTPEENRFWLTLPWDAPMVGLTLQISDLSGTYVSFSPNQGDVLEGLADANGTLEGPYTTISACNAFGEWTGTYYLYVSYQPVPQKTTLQSAAVTIHYVDEYNQPLLPEQTLFLLEGSHTISAEAIENYRLVSPTSFPVTVDAFGGAYPDEITFGYTFVTHGAQVTVHYHDENGVAILPDKTLTLGEGTHTISAQAIEHYTLYSPASFLVTVDANGAYPSEITFAYAQELPTATVTVHYVNEYGAQLMNDQIVTLEEGTHTLSAASIDGFIPKSPYSYFISVGTLGAYPSEITFTYSQAQPTPAPDINDLGKWTIKYYVDKFGDRTTDKYITTIQDIDGLFSNSATTNSKLKVRLLIDNNGYNKSLKMSIMLFEYGSHQIKSSYTRNYSIYIKAADGKSNSVSGSLYSDRISVSHADTILDALKKGGEVRFVIEEKNTVSSYSFTVNAEKFANALYALTSE